MNRRTTTPETNYKIILSSTSPEKNNSDSIFVLISTYNKLSKERATYWKIPIALTFYRIVYNSNGDSLPPINWPIWMFSSILRANWENEKGHLLFSFFSCFIVVDRATDSFIWFSLYNDLYAIRCIYDHFFAHV